MCSVQLFEDQKYTEEEKKGVFTTLRVSLLMTSAQFCTIFDVKNWNNGGELYFQKICTVNVEDGNVWKRACCLQHLGSSAVSLYEVMHKNGHYKTKFF